MSSPSDQIDRPAGPGIAEPACEAADRLRPIIVSVPAGRQSVWWVMTVVLAVIATALVMRWDEAGPAARAWAQTGVPSGFTQAGARGIYAIPGQLTRGTYGLWMVDVDTGTVWCYEVQNIQGNAKLQLLAARSWMFDRFLEEYNNLEPNPGAVQALVDHQKRQVQPEGDATDGAKEAETPRSVPSEQNPK